MVELKIAFSKYDYFGILIPGIFFLTCIFIIIPNEFYSKLNEILFILPNLQVTSIFIFGISFLVSAYIIGLTLSGLSRWVIEDFIIKKWIEYPSKNLFNVNYKLDKQEGKRKLLIDKKGKKGGIFFRKYKVQYSDEFINEFKQEFNGFFNNRRFLEEDKFKLCFTVIKEVSPITFGRLSTFIALYGLYRTLSLAFLILTIIFLINLVIDINIIVFILLISFPLLSIFCFSNYLKFLRTYADELFRSFYIHALKTNRGAISSVQ